MDDKVLSSKKGSFEVQARVMPMGDDLLVVLSGGKGHIGAGAMAEARPSLRDPGKTSATSSVFTYVGHKEDQIVKVVSEELSAKFGRKVVVVAGIHWNALTPGDIRTVKGLCRLLTRKIIEEVSHS